MLEKWKKETSEKIQLCFQTSKCIKCLKTANVIVVPPPQEQCFSHLFILVLTNVTSKRSAIQRSGQKWLATSSPNNTCSYREDNAFRDSCQSFILTQLLPEPGISQQNTSVLRGLGLLPPAAAAPVPSLGEGFFVPSIAEHRRWEGSAMWGIISLQRSYGIFLSVLDTPTHSASRGCETEVALCQEELVRREAEGLSK